MDVMTKLKLVFMVRVCNTFQLQQNSSLIFLQYFTHQSMFSDMRFSRTFCFQPVTESGKKAVVVSSNKPESAFLGPKIWKNPITLPMLSGNNGSGDAEFSIMNIDDFLSENNFDINR